MENFTYTKARHGRGIPKTPSNSMKSFTSQNHAFPKLDKAALRRLIFSLEYIIRHGELDIIELGNHRKLAEEFRTLLSEIHG